VAAMTGTGDNDTSLRSWRRTRRGWKTHGLDSQLSVWWFPCVWGLWTKNTHDQSM